MLPERKICDYIHGAKFNRTHRTYFKDNEDFIVFSFSFPVQILLCVLVPSSLKLRSTKRSSPILPRPFASPLSQCLQHSLSIITYLVIHYLFDFLQTHHFSLGKILKELLKYIIIFTICWYSILNILESYAHNRCSVNIFGLKEDIILSHNKVILLLCNMQE